MKRNIESSFPKEFKKISVGETILVAFSGGIDSTVAACLAKKAGFKVIALAFNHFDNSKVLKTRKVILSKKINIKLYSIDYPKSKQLKKEKFSFYQNINESNSIYYIIAAHFAFYNNIKYIIGGQIREDWESIENSNPNYYNQLNNFIKIELGKQAPKIIMPFINIKKVEVVKIGKLLNVPFQLTWSCDKNDKMPCNECDQCELRKNAFFENNI